MDQNQNREPLADIALVPSPNAPDSTDEKSTSERVVSSTSFLLNLIANGQSHLALGEDGFYFVLPEKGEVDAVVISTLDSIFKEAFVIEDFQYAKIMEAILGTGDFSEWRLRIGGSIRPIDPQKLPAFDRAIIGGEQEGHYEFFSGAPVPADRDEFLAALWKGGIRCGIDTGSLESILAEWSKKPGRYLVARAVAVTEGSNAKPLPRAKLQPVRAIKEPGPNGRSDLHFYECSFPQVPSGDGPHPLLEKIPAVPGKSGRSVGGKTLSPLAVKDFDLSRNAGDGTYVTEIDGKTVIATNLGGQYVEVDPKGRISVSPHAKNSFPVGVKTGSFEVEVEKFEQASDIEREYRLVVRHAEIHGNVRGTVTSKNGNVRLVGNVENQGLIEAENGDIAVEGKALGARLYAPAGKLTVSQAEGSVLFAREIEITGSAVNCFVVADVIRIKKAAGTSFYAQNASIEQLDLTDSLANPVTGFIALRDTLKARKIIRRFEKRRRRLEKVEQIESFIRAQGLSEAWDALDVRMSRKEPLTPAETQAFGPLLQPYEYVRRRKSMATKDRAFFDDAKNSDEYSAAIKAVETHEQTMAEKIGLSIASSLYPPEFSKTLSENSASDPASVFASAPQSFFAYVSSDPSVAEVSRLEDRLRKIFLSRVLKMLAGNVMNEARIRPLRSLSLLRSPCDEKYEFLKALSNDEGSLLDADGDRRNDSARIEIGNDLVIPVLVDGYSVGRMRNVSDHGVSIFFDDTQDNPPVFEKLEEVQIAFKLGETEHRYPLAITTVMENDNAGLVKVGGYYAHANEEMLNKTRRLRTDIETMLAKIRKTGT